MPRVLVAGPNPAWQRILEFPRLSLGAVNRALSASETASGKGLNAARALRRLGHSVSLAQVLAGENGRRCLQACKELGIASLHAWTAGETRVCTTLLQGGTATELIEPFAAEAGAGDSLLAMLEKEGPWDGVLVCGSVPPGLRPDFHSALLERVTAGMVVWDSASEPSPAARGKIAWLKVNAQEYQRLRNGLEDARALPSLLITDGPRPALVRNAGAADGTYPIPHLESIRNPIGAGDTVAAGLLDGLISGLAPMEAVRRALALGAASCMTSRPAEWEPDRAEALAAELRRVEA